MTRWADLTYAQRASFPEAKFEAWKGGYIPVDPEAQQKTFVRPIQPKQPGDIDDQLISFDGRPIALIRWNADGSMSYRD